MNAFGSQKKPTGPLIVGLTGQTGAGKSTVTEAFAEKGFVVIDCDALTRELQTARKSSQCSPRLTARIQRNRLSPGRKHGVSMHHAHITPSPTVCQGRRFP